MYKKTDREQITMDAFLLPFDGKLSSENRWVKMGNIVPWELVEEIYAESFKNERADGRPPISSRMAFGTIFIKENENLTDEQALVNISENPYMQYFLGMKCFQQDRLFDKSMMTHFRKRFTPEKIEMINEEIFRRMHPEESEPPKPPGGDNEGTLILDATAAPSDVRYPTDISLLDECRRNTEGFLDEMWKTHKWQGHKTDYSRKSARKKYLIMTRQRKPGWNKLKTALREQLKYIKKNVGKIEGLELQNHMLPDRYRKRFETIKTVLKQQEEMLNAGKRTVSDRIVNLRQPHVRPIVRGKVSAPTEFGQKIALSVVNGYVFIDGQRWDNFSEGKTLIASAEKYKLRHGIYPEAILADMTYRNRENLRFCKENGIRLSGRPLGRPKEKELEYINEQVYKDSCERNTVEGKIGVSKRRYGLDLIKSLLDCTAMTEAAMNILVMNVAHVMRVLLRRFFCRRNWQFEW